MKSIIVIISFLFCNITLGNNKSFIDDHSIIVTEVAKSLNDDNLPKKLKKTYNGTNDEGYSSTELEKE